MDSASSVTSEPESGAGSSHFEGDSADSSSISSDTYGSAPGSPRDDEDFVEQKTKCLWEECGSERRTLEDLVRHLHEDHIGSRKPKYTCLWVDCPRKGMNQTSRFALVAHLRSHTGEKPFYCSVPECDRSFTRSDALAKHMRTVHETEALRPSDPVPKSHPSHPQSTASIGRVKEVSNSTLNENGQDNGADRLVTRNAVEECKYLKRKLTWAQEQQGELNATLEWVEIQRKRSMVKKELMLERVLKKELGDAEAQAILW